MEKKMAAERSRSVDKIPELLDNNDFLKMDILLKQQAFPSTTNQEFINIE